jgi:hypothetical protein
MSEISEFRNFLIPNTQNALQSASYSHQRGNFERAEKYLDAAERGLEQCREQLRKDKDDATESSDR